MAIISKILTTLILLVCVFFKGQCQKTKLVELPVQLVPANNTKGDVMVLYVTGDGGWNTFSQNMAAAYARAGVPVVALNSAKYFWKKKSPKEAARDVTYLLTEYLTKWNKKKFILCGYSFGADVVPFIFNDLEESLKNKAKCVQLLSPSEFTDFEVHLSYLFISDKMDVVAEVQKISKPVLCYYGLSEKEKPVHKISTAYLKNIVLQGGHHYDDSFDKIVETGLR